MNQINPEERQEGHTQHRGDYWEVSLPLMTHIVSPQVPPMLRQTPSHSTAPPTLLRLKEFARAPCLASLSPRGIKL